MTAPSPSARRVPPAVVTRDGAEAPRHTGRPRRARPLARDRALGLLRFVALAQVLGGTTLVATYASGGAPVDVPGSGAILIAIGALQVGLGLVGTVWARPLQRALKRWPGRFVAAVLIVGTAVAALGGPAPEAPWTTSTQTLMFAAGIALPGLRLLPAGAVAAAGTTVVWLTFGDASGDRVMVVPILAMVKVLFVGLWLGQLAGAAITLLNRWHAVELHERGAILRLRARLARVDARAEALGQALARLSHPSIEIAALRVRLRRGLDLPEAGTVVRVAELVAQLVDEHAAWAPPVALRTATTPEIEALEVDAVIGAELVSAARRQIANVVRHAPEATQVTLAIALLGGQLSVVLTDDGGGTAPTRTGAGTAWSAKQLDRAGGSTRYFDAADGVGLQVLLPFGVALALSDVPTLSIAAGLRRFAERLMTPLRLSGYIGDTAYAASVDGLDERWLLMPVGAVLIELVIWRGLPGRRLDPAGRAFAAALLAAVLLAAFTLPPGSPDEIVPTTTCVVMPAALLLMRRPRRWLVAEGARILAFLPLLLTAGASTLAFGAVYPAAFYGMTYGLATFVRRAERLEGSALDAVGRAALASATVQGLALHHDAIDVLLRETPPADGIEEVGGALEDAVAELANESEPALDPGEIVRSALEASVLVPIHVTADGRPGGRLGKADVLSPLERIALVEIASLAADERASCAPPGLLGRRRLKALHASWATADGRPRLVLRAEPQLRPPDAASVRELIRVGRALGVEVESGTAQLCLTYRG